MAKRISNPGSTPFLAASGRLLFLAASLGMQPNGSHIKTPELESDVAEQSMALCDGRISQEHKSNIEEARRIHAGLERKPSPEILEAIQEDISKALRHQSSPLEIARLTGYGKLWHYLPPEEQGTPYRKMDQAWQHYLKHLRFFAVSHALAESARCKRKDRSEIADMIMAQVKPKYHDETEVIEVLNSLPQHLEAGEYIAAKTAMLNGHNGQFDGGNLLHLDRDGVNFFSINEVEMVVGNGWLQLDSDELGNLRVRNFGLMPDGRTFYGQPAKDTWCGANGMRGKTGAQHANGSTESGGGKGEGNNKIGERNTVGLELGWDRFLSDAEKVEIMASNVDAKLSTTSAKAVSKAVKASVGGGFAATPKRKAKAKPKGKKSAYRIRSGSGQCQIDIALYWTQLSLDQIAPNAGMDVTKLHGVNPAALCDHLRNEDNRDKAAELVAGLKDCNINWAALTYQPGSNTQCENWHEGRYPQERRSTTHDYRALCINLADPEWSAAYAEFHMCGGRLDLGDRICVNTPTVRGCRWKD